MTMVMSEMINDFEFLKIYLLNGLFFPININKYKQNMTTLLLKDVWSSFLPFLP